MSSTWNKQQTWRESYEALKAALIAAQAERDNLRGDTPMGEVAWIVHERDVMHAITNRLRADLGRPPVSEQAIRRAEQRACGHSDYTTKFALGCADIVTEGDQQ